jgi:hypothetical protein
LRAAGARCRRRRRRGAVIAQSHDIDATIEAIRYDLELARDALVQARETLGAGAEVTRAWLFDARERTHVACDRLADLVAETHAPAGSVVREVGTR